MEFLGSIEKSLAPRWLKQFMVTAGRFASVPPWIHGLSFLSFVQITVCNKQTTTDELKILGALPKLQCLILGLDFIPGHAIVIGNEGFRKLQRLLMTRQRMQPELLGAEQMLDPEETMLKQSMRRLKEWLKLRLLKLKVDPKPRYPILTVTAEATRGLSDRKLTSESQPTLASLQTGTMLWSVSIDAPDHERRLLRLYIHEQSLQ
ncbi:unnamed protein product [Miscanthus lutarioriparius]|uniref:Disease resistance R13L4/SHOC-2-like LRR domain-containing protein n=1 Tax=Miscanthus lutarioriparius TaxID=422564 RepID=A0A811QHL6_9POAL|nr:unnamed protein product [Miscanthus lutarioriparius]